jgi:hypothetical protein
MQDAIPHCGFYVMKVHDLIGSFSVVPGGEREKLWQKLFLDLLQWWDHRLVKVSEHQSCQSSHVNGAIALAQETTCGRLCFGLAEFLVMLRFARGTCCEMSS